MKFRTGDRVLFEGEIGCVVAVGSFIDVAFEHCWMKILPSALAEHQVPWTAVTVSNTEWHRTPR